MWASKLYIYITKLISNITIPSSPTATKKELNVISLLPATPTPFGS
jgi:hypothetical protein